jgi:hypothetical protein
MEDYDSQKRIDRLVGFWKDSLKDKALNLFWEWLAIGKFNRRMFKKIIYRFIQESKNG